MNIMQRCTRRFHVLFLCLLFLWAALSLPLSAAKAASVQTIILLPVVFKDTPVDRYEQKIAADIFLDEAEEELQKKGYIIKSVSINAADSTAQARARELAGDADALVVVKIDHYLDAGFEEDTRMANYLEVYASATIYETGSGKLLWEGEGHGTSIRHLQGVSSTRLELSLAAAETISDLFRTLPAPGNWPSP